MTTQTHPTKDQIKRLYTLAGLAGLDHPGVHAEIHDRYGVDSTRELGAREYEQYCRDLEVRGRGRRAAAEAPLTEQAMHHPRVHDRAGCERILAQEWPNLFTGYPDLARPLVEVLDCFRLVRSAGLISPRLLTAEVQRWKRLDKGVLAETAELYLNQYSSRNERYFLGIARRLTRDLKKQKSADERKGEMEARSERAVDARVEAILAGAGAIPVKMDAGCVCTRAEVYFKDAQGGGLRLVPCPWCQAGIAKWRAAIAANRSFGRLDWPSIRDYVAGALKRQGVA